MEIYSEDLCTKLYIKFNVLFWLKIISRQDRLYSTDTLF